ncbi:MAG TPA: hypothetical protein VMV56_09190, partial [Williamwhitmania sp.]|nr:hypothetical protein [Williamwhitmania sp.]
MKKLNCRAISTFLVVIVLTMASITGCIQQQPAKRIRGLAHISSVAFVVPNDTISLPIEEKNDLASLKTVLNISGIRYTEITDSSVKRRTFA